MVDSKWQAKGLLPLRLLEDSPRGGAENMARDEALMLRAGTGESPPTLRLYRWSQPTVSLGYFQPMAEFERLPPPVRDMPVVRRLTGGGAILHDLELTYSLTLPISHPLVGGNPRGLYELAHAAIIESLRGVQAAGTRSGVSDGSGAARGPFFCFARRHELDVLVGADKIAGSAQRRTQHAILQHGSIVLGNRFAQQPTATVGFAFEEAIAVVSSALPRHLATAANVKAERGGWTEAELVLAEELHARYAGETWTRRA